MQRASLTLTLLLVVTLGASAAAAQQSKPDSSKAQLPLVTVTASRSGASLFDTPLAVTQLTKESWRGTSGYGLDDALALVPGVVAQSRYGNNDIRIAIRGSGARGAGDRSNAATARGVRILLNGIPETEPDGRTSLDGIDLASAVAVEVVRSNASALWGNAAGGVVNVSTVPSFSVPFLEEENTIGGFGLKRFALRGGTPAGEARLFGSVVNSSFDGWRMGSSSARTIFDGGLTTPLADRTRFATLLMASRNYFNVPGPLTQAQVDANPRQANATYLARRERRDNKLARLGLTLDRDFDDAQGLSLMAFVTPKYLQRSERGSYRDFTRYHTGGNVVYRNRAVFSPNVTGTFSAGADVAYQDGAIIFYSLTSDGNRGTTVKDDKREGANNFGVFANEDLGLGDRWVLSVGARYDAVTYSYQNYLTPNINAMKSFTRVTPKAGITFKASPTHSVYANVGGGIEVPAGNETDPAPTFGQDTVTAISPLLEPIVSTTYEVGTRQRWLSTAGFLRELSYDAAAFVTDVTNDIVPYAGGVFYFTAGKTRRTGAELGATVRAEGGWELRGALTLMHARYETYLVDSVHYGRAGHFADYSGNKLVGVPDLTVNATLSWAPSPLAGIRVQGTMMNTGDYLVDDANLVKVPSATVFGVGVLTDRAYDIGGGIGLRGFVRVSNVADTRFIGSAFLNPNFVGAGAARTAVAFEPGLPRQVLVSVSFERLR